MRKRAHQRMCDLRADLELVARAVQSHTEALAHGRAATGTLLGRVAALEHPISDQQEMGTTSPARAAALAPPSGPPQALTVQAMASSQASSLTPLELLRWRHTTGVASLCTAKPVLEYADAGILWKNGFP